MIHSSVMDNWMRVKLMHSLASEFYERTRGGKYREYYKSPKDVFFFDVEDYQNIDKERCVVSMLMCWSVITLEALVNHAIAETLKHKLSAVLSIEFPGQIVDKIKKGKNPKSELAKKLIILSDDNAQSSLLDLADSMSNLRNSVVHDKPYEIKDDEGDVKIDHFRSRGEADFSRYTYDDLKDFYKDCSVIVEFINGYFEYTAIDGESVDFAKLI